MWEYKVGSLDYAALFCIFTSNKIRSNLQLVATSTHRTPYFMRTLRPFKLFTLMGVFFGSVTPVEATLHHRGAGLIYDDVLDISWLVDTSYAKSILTSIK